jgi:hypothetical protein
MRVMVLLKASPESEAGVVPSTDVFEAMSRFNDELVNAGVMLAGGGLRPSTDGVRVRFDGPRRTIIDGPFTEAKELVSGYWIWQVRSVDEAVEWLKRAPFDGGTEVEIRPVFEADDFGEAFTPELRERADRQRAAVAARES